MNKNFNDDVNLNNKIHYKNDNNIVVCDKEGNHLIGKTSL